MLNYSSKYFYLLTFSIIILIIGIPLVQDGMFMDGVQYATVSKNLANGIGTFWKPIATQTWFKANSNYFWEHPPLAFGIESLFFKLFGNTIFTERIYCFVITLISILLIHIIWSLFFEENTKYKKHSWLPILLWIAIPSNSWAYHNNMLEITMSLFTLTAIYFGLKSIKSENKNWLWLIFSGCSLFISTFTKGVPGFFPIAIFFCYWLSFKSISLKKTILYTLIIFIIPVIIYSLLIILNNDAKTMLTFYVENRLLHRITNDPTTNNRWAILGRLILELIPHMVILVIILFITRKVKLKNNIMYQPALFMFLIGLTASLPLVLTKVQRGFYLTPSYPYFALSLSFIILPIVIQHINRINQTYIKMAAILIFICSISGLVLKANTFSRDEILLKDIYKIGEIIPQKSIVLVDKELLNNWSLQFYLMRHYEISITTKKEKKPHYYLTKTSKPNVNDLKLLTTNTNEYLLYSITK